jgi:hypothetical protein
MILTARDENVEHLIRAIRENIKSYKRSLDLFGKADRASVAATLGQIGALEVLGVYPVFASEVSDLSKWVWCGEDWLTIKAELEAVSEKDECYAI